MQKIEKGNFQRANCHQEIQNEVLTTSAEVEQITERTTHPTFGMFLIPKALSTYTHNPFFLGGGGGGGCTGEHSVIRNNSVLVKRDCY